MFGPKREAVHHMFRTVCQHVCATIGAMCVLERQYLGMRLRVLLWEFPVGGDSCADLSVGVVDLWRGLVRGCVLVFVFTR